MSAEWELRASLMLPRVLLVMNLLALIMVVTLAMPVSLKIAFGLMILLGMFSSKRAREVHGLRFGFDGSEWWYGERGNKVDLAGWQQLAGLLVLRFKKQPALLIVPDMMEVEDRRELLRLLRLKA